MKKNMSQGYGLCSIGYLLIFLKAKTELVT